MTRRTTTRALGASGVAAASVLALLVTAGASSHREAPLITEDPVADSTDVYAFVSPDDPSSVTIISNWIPLQEPAGGPNFFNFGDDVLYEINIDNDGDTHDDIVYEFRFKTTIENPDTFLYNTGPITSLDDNDFNLRQTYTVTKVEDGRRTELGANLPVPPNNIGPRSTPDYPALASAAVRTIGDGIKVFAGQRDEAFPVDLGSIFDLGALRPLNEAHLAKLPAEPGRDTTAGYNVHSIAIQVPKDQLTAPPNFFDDDNGSAHEAGIQAICAGGVTQGCGPRRYCPRGDVSRAELATFLSRGLKLPASERDFFTDDETSTHEAAINSVAAAGITTGCGTNRYCPDGDVTREQMAAFLSRALKLPAAPRDFFTDDEGSPFEDDINRLAAAGVTSGCGGSSFCPDRTVGRDQMASFLARGLKLAPPADQPVIGVYSTTYRRATRVFQGNDGSRPLSSGPWVQVSRLGMPLVNEVVIPLGQKDRFNASEPADDPQFLSHVVDPELGKLIPVLYPGVEVPKAPRNDLVAIFLTGVPDLNQIAGAAPAEYIRLNTSIAPSDPDPNKQNRLGLLGGQTDGFPNGRRLVDDTVDIALRAVAGGTPFTPDFNKAPNNALGDGVDANDKPLLTTFPYIPHPHQGYES